MNTSFMHITEEQVAGSIHGAGASSEVSVAIEQAEDLCRRGAGEMAVCRTKDDQIEVLSEFSMIVRRLEICEVIYTAPHGFHLPGVA